MCKMKKLFLIFKYSLISGIVIRISDFISVLILTGSAGEWSAADENIAFAIHMVISILLFLWVGFRLKRYTKKEIFFSAVFIVCYYAFILAAEQITQKIGAYSMTVFLWAFLPLELYSSATTMLVKLTSAETIGIIFALPSLFIPFLFCLFGKSENLGNIHKKDS